MARKGTQSPFECRDEQDWAEEAEVAGLLLTVEEMMELVEETEPTASERTFGVGSHLSLTSPPSTPREGKTFVVFNGREVGIFDNWNTVAFLVNKYPGARHASYPTFAEAQHAWEDAVRRNLVGSVSSEVKSTLANSTTLKRTAAPAPNSLNPPPYSGQKTPTCKARQQTPDEAEGPVKTSIKIEEITPRIPRTNVSSPFATSTGGNSRVSATPALFFSALAGGKPRLPTTSPLAAYSRPPATTVMGTSNPTQRNSQSSTASPLAEHPSPISSVNLFPYNREEDSWWVVSVGNRPGVYHGKSNACSMAGTNEDVHMSECRNGLEQACQLFVDLYAARCVRRLGRPPNSSYQPQHFLPLASVANDNFWYVVPRGPHPGVYEGRRTAYRMSGPAAEHMLRCESECAAYDLFVELYMSLRIQEY